MSDKFTHADGARVLADLNALRSIGTFETGVHKPSVSEPHMASLHWLAARLAEAGLAAAVDGIGNVLGTSTNARAETSGRFAPARTTRAGSMARSAWSMCG